MLSCFGLRKNQHDEEHRPLLPQYNDETDLQQALHEKLHTYQLIQALRQGYFPSTEQLIANLRCLLAADLLNPSDPSLSPSGRILTERLKSLIKHFITLLQNKNDNDQAQRIIWLILQVRISLDVNHLSKKASRAKTKADATALYEAVRTIGTLLLTNADFRLFLSDLTTLVREVFQDTAVSISVVAEETGNKLAPSDHAVKALELQSDQVPPTNDDLGNDITEVADTIKTGASTVVKDTQSSLNDKLSGAEGNTLQHRLKHAVLALRKRPDYESSVSTFTILIRRWVYVYSRGLEEASSSLQEDIHENEATDRVVRYIWELLSSFGDKKEWDELQTRLKQVMSHAKKNDQVERFMRDLTGAIQSLLLNPEFLNSSDKIFSQLKNESKDLPKESTVKSDVDAFISQVHKLAHSIWNDIDVANIYKSIVNIFDVISPSGEYVNTSLVEDSTTVFIPTLLSAIQLIPIPRLEISTPAIDILLENLFVTPGKTVNHSSFLPYRVQLTSLANLSVRKSHTLSITSASSTKLTLRLDGISLRAEDIGFWLRLRQPWPLSFLEDEGLASIALDEKGLDVHIDVDVSRHDIDSILSLKAVRVQAHKLQFNLKSSKFSFLAFIFRPILQLILRKVFEKQLATAITDGLRAMNRELVYMRERLRATRVAEAKDWMSFFKAILARWTPEDDPDLYARIGIDEPGQRGNTFAGRYAPGSLAKVWREEGIMARYRVQDQAEAGEEGWRNEIFDVHGRTI